jgi:hypothetical protein
VRSLPRLSRNMMASIADFSPIPRVHCRNILPGKRRDRLASGREMLPKPYEALARLSRSLTAGTPEDWIGISVPTFEACFPSISWTSSSIKRTKTRSSGAHLQPSKPPGKTFHSDQTIRNSEHARGPTSKFIAIIDDDESMQGSLRDLIESTGLVARCFGSPEEFLG